MDWKEPRQNTYTAMQKLLKLLEKNQQIANNRKVKMQPNQH